MPGLLARIVGRFTERRDLGAGLGFIGGEWWGSAGFGGGYDKAVAPAIAQGLDSVVACVELISSSLAALPVSLTIDTDAGRQPAPSDAPGWKLLRRPNEFQSWPAYVATVASEMLLQGNSVSWLKMDQNGEVAALVPCPWPWLRPVIIDTGTGPRLVLDRIYSMPVAQLLGLPARLLPDAVMHIRGRSDECVIGRSVIGRAAAPLREGLEIQTVAASTWSQGMRPSGVYSIEGTIDEDARKRFRANIKEMHEGTSNAGRMLILDRNGKFTQTSMSLIDSDFMAGRAFSVAAVARMFGVPEPMIQLGARVPSDMSQFMAQFATTALAPLVALIETEFDTAVLGPDQHLQIDMSGLLRGSHSAAVASLAVGKQSGFLTANDCRRSLGLAPLEGGDVLTTGAPPSYPADAKGMPALHPSPGPGGDGPNVGTNQNGGSG